MAVKFASNSLWLYYLAILMKPSHHERERVTNFKNFVNSFIIQVVGGTISRAMTLYIVWCYLKVHLEFTLTPMEENSEAETLTELMSSYLGDPDNSVSES